MKKLMRSLSFTLLTVPFLVACGGGSSSGGGGLKSSDLQNWGTLIGTIATDDPEQGRRIGQATGELAGLASDVTPEQELAMGEGLALQAFQQIGPRHEDEELQRYVNLVALAVARQSPRPDLKFSTTVLDSSSINAFAAPGGYLFVTTGALRLMENEAQLAAVLGHEISHVTERHMIETFKRNRLFSAASSTLEAVDAEKEEYSQRINAGEDLLFNRGLDQKYEFEADRVGLELATLTGYDPNGMSEFLNNLSRHTGQSGGMFQTHPPTTSRLNAVNSLTRQYFPGMTGAQNTARFQRSVLDRLPKTY